MNKCMNPLCENEAKAKYCSKSCAAIVNNSKYPKREPALDCICIRCGVAYRRGRNATGKYCSMLCSQNHRREVYIADWLLSKNNGSTKDGELDVRIRKYLISEAGNKCTECSWGVKNPVLDKVILTIEHIDGNWKNNTVDNLKVLCYNCHTLTETFGSLNKGNFPENKRNVGSRRH